ncbi:hypothetical protein ACQ4M3_09370 [Leptolyngbya sp. AN03gr2]
MLTPNKIAIIRILERKIEALRKSVEHTEDYFQQLMLDQHQRSNTWASYVGGEDARKPRS